MSETDKQSGTTLGGYVRAEIADAARKSAEHCGMKISPWVAEAIEQRLDREGRLPHQRTETDEAMEKAKAVLEAIGPAAFVELIQGALTETCARKVS